MIGSQKVARFNNNKQKSKWLTIITTALQDKCIRETGSVQIVVHLSQNFLSNQIHHEQENFFVKIVTDRKDLPSVVVEEDLEVETEAIEAVASKSRCTRETGNAQAAAHLSQNFLSNQIHLEKDNFCAEIVTDKEDLTNLSLKNKTPAHFARVFYLKNSSNLFIFSKISLSIILTFPTPGRYPTSSKNPWPETFLPCKIPETLSGPSQ